MPLLKHTLISHHIAGSHYGFSAKRIEDLGACEYTLVGLAADSSGSVCQFQREIEEAIKNIVLACYRSPRADNLMLRFTRFDDSVHEVHGLKPLPECHPADYDHTLVAGGCTALYDATHNAITAIGRYAESLSQRDFDVNGIVFVVTDGGDNASTMTSQSVKEALAQTVSAEHLESLTTILIGVNVKDATISSYLKAFSRDAGFDRYIELERADEQTLAHLADFMTQSISMQSRALGTGLKSTLLSF